MNDEAKGHRLSPAHVAAVVSFWARSRPAAVRSFAAGDAWCHLFLWNVCACCEDEIEIRDGMYVVAAPPEQETRADVVG